MQQKKNVNNSAAIDITLNLPAAVRVTELSRLHHNQDIPNEFHAVSPQITFM